MGAQVRLDAANPDGSGIDASVLLNRAD